MLVFSVGFMKAMRVCAREPDSPAQWRIGARCRMYPGVQMRGLLGYSGVTRGNANTILATRHCAKIGDAIQGNENDFNIWRDLLQTKAPCALCFASHCILQTIFQDILSSSLGMPG
jgi:hypothetical protein